MKNKMQQVLVAGGAGFIGSHLCEALLARGMRVLCVDSFLTGTEENLRRFSTNRNFTYIEQDIITPLRQSIDVDAVVNLACPASPPHYGADPIHTMMTSVVGTHQLLEFAAARRARFIQASTSEIYGDPQMWPQRESYFGNVNPNGPRACYDEGKRAAETLCCDYQRRSKLDVRIMRIFNTYGPRMRVDDGRVVSNVVCQALAGADITIYGDGSQTRSFCYVDDLVEGIMKMLDHAGPFPGVINLGNPVEITVLQLVEKVLSLTGSRSRKKRMPLPIDDPKRRCPDISKAREYLGWRPRTDLDAGLRRTIAWFSAVSRRSVEAGASRKRRAAGRSAGPYAPQPATAKSAGAD